MDIYEPGEDSLFLKEFVKDFAKGKVLDMGTGSGILAESALGIAEEVYAVDINKDAVERLKKDKRIQCHVSNLFSYFDGKNIKFDTIIFNPPYLPKDKNIEDPALYGGRHGYELIRRFLSEASDYLHEDGQILLLFSSITNKEKVEESIEKNMLVYEELGIKKLFFEEIYVYRIVKSDVRKDLESKGVTSIAFLDRGKRGMIFTGCLDNKKVAVKIKRPSSKAVDKVKNESRWLREMNKLGIGPRLLFSSDDYVAYEFAPGNMILDYCKDASKRDILNVVTEVFRQCFVMDSHKVDKEEMHHPVKHIVIGEQVVMIDFERMHVSVRPKNVTQFCQFVASGKFFQILKDKGIIFDPDKILFLAKEYKKSYSETDLKNILKSFKA